MFQIPFYGKKTVSRLMRIWDISPKILCRNHLLGEHRELHAIWSILIHDKKGYAHHPETLRWKNKRNALYVRHELLVQAMKKRGYNHNSPLDNSMCIGLDVQNEHINTVEEQIQMLRNKKCKCKV